MAGLSESAKYPASGRRARALTGLALGLAVASSAASAVTPVRPATLCLARETPLFSCPVGAKIASVCGGTKGAVYRYGRPGRVELTARDLTTAYRGFSGGGGTQITATNGRFRYTVYTKTVRTNFDSSGRNDPQDSSGLVVRRGARTLMSRGCSTEPVLQGDVSKLIRKGPYLDL